jgi:hypothetical protein
MALNPKNYIKKRFNFAKWVGADELKQNASMLKDLVKPQKSTEEIIENKQAKTMSFEELIQVNQWTNSDIEKNKIYQVRMCYGFLTFSAIILLIAIYLFIISNIFGGIFSLIFMLLGLAYAYQSWVSYEQLKQRKIRIRVRASFVALFKKKK